LAHRVISPCCGIWSLPELAAIHRRLERLEEQGASTVGFAKEIDHALQRIAAIERQLGITKKTAA
jgi:hypothetical protein